MFDYYIYSFVILVVCTLLGKFANWQVCKAYSKYLGKKTKSHTTGYDTATKLLRSNSIYDVEIGKTKYALDDHYNPIKKTINLSSLVYDDDSIASVAVAAHEVGHVVQNKKGYFFYKIRAALVPVTKIGSRLAVPLVLLGFLLDFVIGINQDSNVGYFLAMAGVMLYGLSTVFALVTLPVELNASKRAKEMLLNEKIIESSEVFYVEKMLSAAAMTYVANLLISTLYFMRFVFWVLLLFNRRRRR